MKSIQFNSTCSVLKRKGFRTYSINAYKSVARKARVSKTAKATKVTFPIFRTASAIRNLSKILHPFVLKHAWQPLSAWSSVRDIGGAVNAKHCMKKIWKQAGKYLLALRMFSTGDDSAKTRESLVSAVFAVEKYYYTETHIKLLLLSKGCWNSRHSFGSKVVI